MINKKFIKWIALVISLTGVLFGVSIMSLLIGSADIPLRRVFSIIIEGKGTPEYSIIFDIRLPRILLGIAIGGMLSISGVLLQGLFRNPLVEPYTLGISGGAALGVCLNILFGLFRRIGVFSLTLSGFLGAIGVILVLYILSVKREILKIQGLLLTGVMISFICSALVMLIMAISRIEDLHGIVFWIMGSLDEPNQALIGGALVILVLGLITSYLFWPDLNALTLGEEEAHHLGVNIERTKKALFILSSLLTGCCVSVAGIIGFVGLVVPHFIRLCFGQDHRILIIGSFLCGASFLIICDTIARTIIAPLELPIGVVTGIFGGTFFVYLLTKKQVRVLTK